ncbi:MAG: class I SAM-dependent methyltransferase [Deltaproteobacteria bacterium]|nr:class I SAM-dependent methyltransferase [Deltaproteobacteria bacterium]
MKWFEKLLPMNDRVCPWWMCYTFDNPLRRLIQDPERLLEPYVKLGMTAVDIGCGMGYFTLGMAKLVGPGGKVIAVDLQEEMLAALGRRALKAGLSDRIVPHRCRPDILGVEEPSDFVLAFWMVHEVRGKPRFFAQISALLKPGGRLLLVEPKLHVNRIRFGRTVEACRAAGFRLLGEPAIALSRAVLMEKSGPAASRIF